MSAAPVRGSDTSKKPAAKPKTHAHGCTGCDTRYEDACATPTVDGLCMACRGGCPWQLLIDSRAPRACCVASSRRTTKDEREKYRLAGNPKRTWWICGECKRTQVYRPKPKEVDLD